MKTLLSFLLIALGYSSVYAQCDLTAGASSTTVVCGESVNLDAFGSSSGTVLLNEDFNTGGFGAGWNSTPGSTSFSNPCSPGGVDGTPHAWMDNNTTVPRTLTSAAYDLSAATAGVTICFDMLFAEQGDAAPCEGPDEPDEGVYLQYSIDGGATWVDIHYFDPNGGNDPQLTNWNNWCFQIPLAAITSNTMFQWHQIADSGADYDHWGIDNVEIFMNDVNSNITWQHDGYSYGVGSSGGVNPNPVTPTTTTTYTAMMVTGTNDTCYASVTVNVVSPTVDVSLTTAPSAICVGDCATVSGTAVIVQDPGGIETYENNELAFISGAPGLPGLPPFIPPTPGNIEADVNINVVGLNTPTVSSGLIQSVCISGFNIISGGSTTLADVSIVLTCPSGASINLVNIGDLSGTSISNMCFEMGAPSVATGSAPYSGTFAPAQSFAGLNGCNSEGVWNIVISGEITELTIPLGSFSGWNITFDDPPILQPVCASWSPTTGVSNPSSINTDLCPVTTTDYTLSISNCVPGCATFDTIIPITVNPCGGCVPPNINIVSPLTACAPNTVDLANAIGAGSDPANLTYYNTQADAQAATGAISGIVGVSGSYWVRAEDPTDPTCFLEYEILVEINDLSYSVVIGDENCGSGDGVIDLTPNLGVGPYTYSIDNGATTQGSGLFSGLTAGAYNVLITDNSTGCTVSGVENVGSIGGPTIDSLVEIDPGCAGACDGTLEVFVSGGTPPYSYQWFDGLGNPIGGNSPTLSALCDGNYSVEVTDAAGICPSTEFGTLTEPAAVDPSFVLTDFCEGSANAASSVATAGGTFAYNPDPMDGSSVDPVTGEINNGVPGTTYSVEYTVGGACPVSSIENVTVLAVPVPTIVITDETCLGDNDGIIDVTSVTGTGPFTYSWSIVPNPGTALVNGLSPGAYTVTIEDQSNSCTSDSTVNVGAGPVCCTVTIDTLSTTSPSCGQNDGVIDVTAAGGSGAYTFSINGGAFGASTNFTGLSSGAYQLVVDDGTCLDTIDVQLSDIGAPAITSIAPTGATCNGTSDGELVIVASGGTGTLNYEISLPPFVDNNTTGSFTGLAAGNYTVTVTDQNGCQATGNIVVDEPVAIVPNIASTDVSCFEANDGSITVGAVGGTPNYEYSIDNGTTWSANGSFSNLNAQTYNVVVQDANGCTSVSTQVNIIEPPQLSLDITGTAESCVGSCDGNFVWNGVGGSPSYTLLMDGNAQASSPISNLCEGTYNFTLTDSRGCSVDTMLTLEPAIPVVISDVVVTDDGCSDECDGTILVTSPTAVSYVLSNGAVSATGSFTNLCSGVYSVQAVDANGCNTEVDVVIGTAVPAEADFAITPGQVSEFNSTTQIFNFSNNADFYVWNIEGPNGFIDVVNGDIDEYDFPSVAGGYNVCLIAMSSSGCQDTMCAPVLVAEEFTLYIPNTFTPDGDEFNQNLQIYVNGIDDFGFSMLIFNRWGEVIWESNDPSVAWDGTYHGKLVQDGTYVWKVVVKDPHTDDRKEFVGHVNVLK